MAPAASLIPFDNNPTARQLADDNSLLQIDRELDALLEQIEDEIEEQGEASTDSMDLLRVFVEAIKPGDGPRFTISRNSDLLRSRERLR